MHLTGSRLTKTSRQKETGGASTSLLPDPPLPRPFPLVQTRPCPTSSPGPRSCPLPLNPAHAPPPPLRSLSHCPAATVASGSPAPPLLPHPRSGSRLPFSSLPLSVARDRLAGGVWERGTCEQVSSLDAEKTVPSTDRCARGWGDGGQRREEG